MNTYRVDIDSVIQYYLYFVIKSFCKLLKKLKFNSYQFKTAKRIVMFDGSFPRM